MAVTIRDVAQAANVSKSAVSFALNDRPGISDSTREHILKVSADLGWEPSVRARALSVAKSFAVGLVITRARMLGSDPFFPALIVGVEATLSGRGYALVLRVVEHLEDEPQAYERLAAEGRADGFILTDLQLVDPRIELLGKLGLPVVTLGHPDPETPLPFQAVYFDERNPVKECVRHLIGLGRVRIAHVGGVQSMAQAQHRREAWVEAMEEAGLVPDLLTETDHSGGSAVLATNAVLDAGATAIIYCNLIAATAGMTAIRSRGLRIPEDVAVTGFDCTEFSQYLHPALTSVQTDPAALGAAAANALLALIDGAPVGEDVLIPVPGLVVRGSTVGGHFTDGDQPTAWAVSDTSVSPGITPQVGHRPSSESEGEPT